MSSQTTETMETVGVAYTRNHPYTATVTANRLLTGSGSEKETRHIEVDIAGSGITYLPGDWLASCRSIPAML